MVSPCTTRSRSSTETPYSPATVARRLALFAFQPPETTSSASARRSKSVRSSALSPTPGRFTASGARTPGFCTDFGADGVLEALVAPIPADCNLFAARRAAAGCSGPFATSAISACNRSAADSNCCARRFASALPESGWRATSSRRFSSAASI